MKIKTKIICIFIASICICNSFANETKDFSYEGYKCKESVIESDYYDRIDVYYNEIEFDALNFISDYYLVAHKNNEKIVLGYFGFGEDENNNKEAYGITLDTDKKIIYKTRIAGTLYNSNSNYGNYVIYGYHMDILNNPLSPAILWQKRDSQVTSPVKSEDGFMICVIDSETNMLRQFNSWG